MIVEAGGRFSFADAAFALQLAGVSISPRHIRHLTLLIGWMCQYSIITS